MDAVAKHWQDWGQLIVRSWKDDALRARILREPRLVLREIGVDLPDDLPVYVVEMGSDAPIGDEDALVLPLPPPPGTRAPEQLSEAALDLVTGGAIATAFRSLPDGSYLSQNVAPLRSPQLWGSSAALP